MNKKSRLNKEGLISVIIMLIISVVLIIGGGISTYKSIRKYSTYKEVTALVVEVYSDVFSDDEGSTTKYQPVFEYVVDGVKYKTTNDIYVSKHYRKGNKIKAYYNTENPSEACVSKDYVGVWFMLFGIMFLAVAVLALLKGESV